MSRPIADGLRCDRSHRIPPIYTLWPSQSRAPALRSTYRRLKNLPGARRSLRTTRPAPLRFSKTLLLPGYGALADDSDDEEGDHSGPL